MSTRRLSPRTEICLRNGVIGMLAGVCLGSLILGPAPAAAQSTAPSAACQKATLVVPAGSGSGTDLIAREIAGAANRAGAAPPIIVRNIDGNDGFDGGDVVRQAPGDGCMMLFTHQGLLANFLSWKAPFSWHEFRHGALLTRTPMALVASAEAGFEDVAAMLEAARDGTVTMATGDGDVSTFALRAMAEAADVDFEVRSVDGARERIKRLMAGEVDVIMVPTALAQRLIETGKVVPIAVTDIDPSARLPDLGTLEEQGVAFSHAIDLGILLPASTSLEQTRKITDVFQEAMRDQSLIRNLDAFDVRVDFRPMTQYTVYWENLMAVWREMAVQAGYRRASR